MVKVQCCSYRIGEYIEKAPNKASKIFPKSNCLLLRLSNHIVPLCQQNNDLENDTENDWKM